MRVRSERKNGDPLPGGRVVIRYNGEFVPGLIAGAVGIGRNGEALLRRLPAGTYEIWVLFDDDDDGTSREPVRVGLSGGEETVTVVANF